MPLKIVRNDITKMNVDAIVNAANNSLLGGGGVDGCIHRAAGPLLLEECKTLGGCPTGSAKITGAYNLPCRYVIHTVGPRWKGGHCGEKELLTRCYRTSLALAQQAGCESVAFPLISSGIYGYPKDQALHVAVTTIQEFLLENEMTVYLVVFGKNDYLISSKLFTDIKQYIDDRYVKTHTDQSIRHIPEEYIYEQYIRNSDAKPDSLPMRVSDKYIREEASCHSASAAPTFSHSLNDAINQIDESFSEMLLRKIDESGMSDAQCYKKANIDRKLFSKIRNNAAYKPSKPTVIAFAIALELSLDETRDLLMKAGFALSHSYKFDIIIEYFLTQGNYNIFEINEALFAFDQTLLGT